jgi:hypothetical protein
VETVGKLLLATAIVLAVIGALLLLAARLGLDHLPGDVVIRGRNVTVYAPLGLMIVVSLVLTLVVNLVWRR